MLEPLTQREQEILLHISQGMTNREIADALYLARGTIKAHCHNIYSKLGVTNRTQAVLKAQELGLIEADNPPPSWRSTLPKSTLPPQLTPFIGRKQELDSLMEMLTDERVRLITILGAGGMGKTRLSIELARKADALFEDGVAFISLAPIADPKNIAPAVIDELGLRFQAGENPAKQLIAYIQDKNMLLVLDNFEHLLEGTGLITDILAFTPQTKLLVTSRERLNLSTEIIFVLGGLEYSFDGSTSDLMRHDAVQLMLERIQAAHPGYALSSDDWLQVQRICQLTNGMPLAIVLATSWLHMLTLKEIADELSESIDILESEMRDLPVRQRSIRATIEASWHRLTNAEQQVLTSLSVFRGGFTREAAKAVTGARLPDLQKLSNCSFITFHDGRYEQHELLRQFAEMKLAQNPQDYHHIHNLHCDYYTYLLEARLQDIFLAKRFEVISEIQRDLGNIYLAWWWAVEHVRIDAMRRASETISSFWHTQGRYTEGIESLSSAVQALKQSSAAEHRDLLIANMSTDLGWYHIRLGQLDEANALFHEAYELYEQLAFPFVLSTTDPLIGLSIIASIQGDYETAARIAEQALQQNRTRHHISNQAYALYALTGINLAQGHYEQARDYGQQAVATVNSIATPDQWLLAYCLIELASVERAMGEYQTAQNYYEESYRIKEQFQDPEGMALVLGHLGQLALRQNKQPEAERMYQQSLQIYREIQDKGGLATVQHGMGQVALARGDYELARHYLRQALRAASEIDYMPLLFAVLLTVAELRLQTDHVGSGLSLLDYISQHPSSSQETRSQAARLLAGYRKSGSYKTAQDIQHSNLMAIVNAIDMELLDQ